MEISVNLIIIGWLGREAGGGGGGIGGFNEIFLQTKSFRVNPGLFGAVLSLLLLCFV